MVWLLLVLLPPLHASTFSCTYIIERDTQDGPAKERGEGENSVYTSYYFGRDFWSRLQIYKHPKLIHLPTFLYVLPLLSVAPFRFALLCVALHSAWGVRGHFHERKAN